VAVASLARIRGRLRRRRGSYFFEHEDTVKADHFPLLLNLFLGQAVHAVFNHALEKLLLEVSLVAVLALTRIGDVLVEELMKVHLFDELEAVLGSDRGEGIERHQVLIDVLNRSRCHFPANRIS